MTLGMNEEDFQAMLESMLQLRLDPPQDSDGGGADRDHAADQCAATVPAQPVAAAAENNLQDPSGTSGAEWVDILMSEMASATSMDDARSRAARLLEAFQGSVLGSRAARVLDAKDRVLGAALRQNGILKRSVAVQHRRHLEDEEKGRELQELVAGYREQVRWIEADNYALSMHLRNARPGTGSSLPGSFHPEVF